LVEGVYNKMSIEVLFDQAGLAFVIVATLFMVWFRDWKASVTAGLIFSAVILGDRLISFYINHVAGSIFILLIIIGLIVLEYRKKPK
jgi:predicted membrane protein